MVGAAEQKGRRLISVTINAPDDWRDHKAMLDEGFSRYQLKDILEEGKQVGSLTVMSGAAECVPVTAGEQFSVYLLPEETVSLSVKLPLFVYAPVERDRRLAL